MLSEQPEGPVPLLERRMAEGASLHDELADGRCDRKCSVPSIQAAHDGYGRVKSATNRDGG
jgi:hypothetical protein